MFQLGFRLQYKPDMIALQVQLHHVYEQSMSTLMSLMLTMTQKLMRSTYKLQTSPFQIEMLAVSLPQGPPNTQRPLNGAVRYKVCSYRGLNCRSGHPDPLQDGRRVKQRVSVVTQVDQEWPLVGHLLALVSHSRIQKCRRV